MGLDFDQLSEKSDFCSERTLNSGKPLDVLLSDIVQNPDNPRKEFDKKHLTDLAADIKQNSVKSPVSIRKNPTGETQWVLNFGACRYRASQLAGRETIPAFIDEQFTDYDAVAENEIRQSLTAMELALFIQKRKSEGDSNSKIATQLQKDRQAITHHLALIDMPDSIAEAYRSGTLKAAKAIYDLVGLNKKHEKEVTKFCKQSDVISYADVRKLSLSLKRPESQPELPIEPPTAKPSTNAPSKSKSAVSATESLEVDVAKFANIPAIHVDVNGERAVIVLERKPTNRGMIWVRYLSSDATTEVKAEGCKLIELINSEKTTNLRNETA